MSYTIELHAIILDARDPKALMEFYKGLLGWELNYESDEYCMVGDPSGKMTLGAQRVPDYQRPVWPPEAGRPDQGAHCDFQVSDLAAAVKKAEELGAVKASQQFIDGLTVMIDPEGHPFCLFPGTSA